MVSKLYSIMTIRYFFIALSKKIKKFKNYVKVCERLSLAKQMYDRNT